MTSVLAAPPTELLELKTFRRGLLILCGRVVATFAITTLEHNVIARHNVPLNRSLYFVLCTLYFVWSLAFGL